MTDRSRLQNRIELLGTCAMMAATIAIAHSSESFAQSAFQGTPTVASGDASIVRGGPGGGATAVDTISLNSQFAIINWDTFDRTTNTPIDFLPQNTVARFQSFNQNFTVLNRVFAATPGQAISINGTIQSVNFSNQTTGNIWFYSPGGIIAGPTSVFNVGNLILTADDIDTTGGLFGPNNTLRFRGGAGSTSAVTIQPGAQINLNNTGSYLALVAPQVTMGGTATINGSAAYIAAEQVDVRINGGAFDIAFVTGTGVANALIHSGTTTGPAAANGTIAMAAMPKNTAITMLVSGTVGYTPAATATVQNGTIVLSAGQDVAFGAIGQNPSVTAANLTIGSGTFRTQVNAQATNILASPTSNPLSFTGNVSLTGLTSAEVRADAAETITVGGNLTLVSRRPDVGGTARLIADGIESQITVSGLTQVDASAVGVLNFSGVAGNAVGGTAEIIARQGDVLLANARVTADGTGGYGSTRSGNGAGGTARVRTEQTRNTGLFSGDLLISAAGQGGQGGGQFPASPIGGNATGGQALFEIANQGSATTGNLVINANAFGGAGGTTGSTGGAASGGTAQIDMGTGSLGSRQTTISADERSGFAGPGGTTGSTSGTGVARVRTQSGRVSLDSLVLTADARAASPVRLSGTAPAVEGALRAGTAEILASLGVISADNQGIFASASAYGLGPSFATTAGAVTGGTINVSSTNSGSISSLGLFAQALAFGTAASATPGNATAGRITVSNSGNGGFFLDPDDTPHDISLDAYAVGASGAAPAAATGGQISITFGQGTARGIGSVRADTTGFSGASTTGGIGSPGRGGSIVFSIATGANVTTDSIDLTSDGTSIDEREGFIGPGAGSAATGGTVTVNLSGGNLTTDNFNVSASARGPYAFALAGAPANLAGPGIGGSAIVTLDGTTVNAGLIDIAATGTGGRGAEGSLGNNTNATSGGNGTGGTATLQLNSGALNAATISISANGVGGEGGYGYGTGGAAGGTGIGGTATFRNLASSTVTTNEVNVFAQGAGGLGGLSDYSNTPSPIGLNGGNGGGGGGGTALIDWQGAAVYRGVGRPSLSALASGEGEDGGQGYDNAPGSTGTFGGQGGDGRGGTSTILISGGSTQFGSIVTGAYAYGGDGATGNATRRGGDAVGGTAELRVTNAALVAGIVTVNSFAGAGASPEGRFGAGPRGGDATGGTSLFEVSGFDGSYVASAGAPYAYGGVPTFTLSADANATNGISGSNGTTGGAGGRGGNALGGQVTVRAIDGAIDISGTTVAGFNVGARGGDAGNGGNASTYQSTGGGRGGDAGTGIAGTILFTARGGQLTTGDLNLEANAIAGSVGYGGFDAGVPEVPGIPASPGVPGTPGVPAIPPAYGGFGAASFGQGGSITIESLPGDIARQDARVTGGNVIADVSASTNGYGDFGYAGSVSISNLNTGGRALQLGSLTVDAGSDTGGSFSGTTTLTAINSPIAVNGDIRVTGPTSAYVRTRGTGFVTATGLVDLNVQGYIGIDQFGTGGQPALKAGSISAVAGNSIDAQGALVVADNDMTLSSAYGSILTGILTVGRDIRVTADAGNISLGAITAGRNAMIYGSPTTSPVTVETVNVGGFLEARGATLNFGNVTVGTDAILSSFDGSLTVGNVTAGDDIFLTVNGSAANPNTISPDSQTGAGGTTAFALVAGNIRSTGLGSDTAASGPATFTGAGPTGNVVRIRASGTVQTGSVTTAGNAILSSDSQSVTAGAVSATAGIGVFARTNVTLGNATTNGAFWLGNSSQYFLNVPTYQVTNFPFFQTPTNGSASLANVTAGLIRGTTTGSTTFNNLTATSDIFWSTGNSNAIGGNIAGNSISAGAVLNLVAGQSVSFTDATAQGSALVVGSTGSVAGNLLRSTGSTVDASGNTGVIIGTVTTPARATLDANVGNISVTGNLTAGDVVATGRNVQLYSPGDLAATSLLATAGNIDVSTQTNLSVVDARATGNVYFSALGNARLDTVRSGLDTTVTGRSIDVRIGVGAQRSLLFDATNTISVNGGVNAPLIELRSGDINIGGEYRVGTIGYTQRLLLTNTSTTQTFIGGADHSGAYSLSGSEMTRLAADNISIFVSPQSQNQGSIGQTPLALTPNVAPDLILDTFTVAGGQNLGTGGTLLIQTPGKMRVVGAVTLDGMTASNRLDLRAVTAIEALPTSSIVIRNTNGLTGTLAMTAEDIIASSSSALADVAATTSLTTASDRLGANNSTASDSGYFQAGGIVVTVSKGVYVQNTGTSTSVANRDFATRRGFTVGSNGFTVVQASGAPVRVAINGRQVVTTTTATGAQSASGFTTGIDMIPLIKFVPFAQPAGSRPLDPFPATGATPAQLQAAAAIFDPLSTVNGCTIVSSSSCQGTVVNDPIRDILAGDFGEKPVANLFPISIVQLKDYSAAGDEPLIDEPVTGAGNDDLWSVDDSTSCDPAKEVCK